MSADDVERDDDADGAALHRANSQQAHINRLERLRSTGDSSVIGVSFHKVCCVCGEVLNGKTRFKDSQGRYWCPTCNEADHAKVKPEPCADCGIEMSRMDLKEVNGLLLCPVCVSKCMEESRAVTEVRLRALAHHTHTASADKKPKGGPAAAKKKSNTLLVVILGGIVIATIVAILVIIAM